MLRQLFVLFIIFHHHDFLPLILLNITLLNVCCRIYTPENDKSIVVFFALTLTMEILFNLWIQLSTVFVVLENIILVSMTPENL